MTDHFCRLPVAAQSILWFLLILVIKFDTLLAPPVWDTAMGVFPPAIYLYENSFNVFELVQLQGWWEGGPNVHSLSLWTWLIALVMTVTHSPVSTFFILHSLTFALNALAICLLVRTLYLMQIKSYLAISCGLLLLLTPLVLVQVGYMYTESPVMALSILVWVSWYHQREGLAVLLTLLALSIKLTGLIVGLCLIPLLMLRLIENFSVKRLVLVATIPIGFFLKISLYGWFNGIPQNRPWGSVTDLFNQIYIRLNSAPDVTALILAGLLAGILYPLSVWYKSKTLNPISNLYRYCIKDGNLFIVSSYPFLFCIGAIVTTYSQEIFLYRYAIPIIPFAMISMAVLAQAFKAQSVLAISIVIACAFAIYNYNGKLYSNSLSFSITENSHAYQGYAAAKRDVVEQLALLDNDKQIYVSREVDYMASHPMMGYLDAVNPNIIGIYKKEYANIEIASLPRDFYLVYTNPVHGGERIAALGSAAVNEGGWRVERIYDRQYLNHRMRIRRLYK